MPVSFLVAIFSLALMAFSTLAVIWSSTWFHVVLLLPVLVHLAHRHLHLAGGVVFLPTERAKDPLAHLSLRFETLVLFAAGIDML